MNRRHRQCRRIGRLCDAAGGGRRIVDLRNAVCHIARHAGQFECHFNLENLLVNRLLHVGGLLDVERCGPVFDRLTRLYRIVKKRGDTFECGNHFGQLGGDALRRVVEGNVLYTVLHFEVQSLGNCDDCLLQKLVCLVSNVCCRQVSG